MLVRHGSRSLGGSPDLTVTSRRNSLLSGVYHGVEHLRSAHLWRHVKPERVRVQLHMFEMKAASAQSCRHSCKLEAIGEGLTLRAVPISSSQAR